MADILPLANLNIAREAAEANASSARLADACLAKNAAVTAGEWVVDQAVQLHGGAGYLRETEVERHYRDVRILGIGGGATEVLADLAGRLLGFSVEGRAVDGRAAAPR